MSQPTPDPARDDAEVPADTVEPEAQPVTLSVPRSSTPPKRLRRYMRRLPALAVVAAVVAGGMSVSLPATQAHAMQKECWYKGWFLEDGVWYQGWFKESG